MQARVTSSARPTAGRYLDPIAMLASLYSHRNLIKELTWRESMGRYKGSYLGMLWSIITPLMMLSVYSFIFGAIFQGRWGVSKGESQLEYALALFCGLILFTVFSDCVTRAPRLVLDNPNYVKKVVFPLEILPVTTLLSSLIHGGISLCILLLALILSQPVFSGTWYLFPLVLFPLCALSLGISWFLCSLGVFFRDVGHTISIAVQALLMVSGVFFPISAVPDNLRGVVMCNPLVTILEDARRTLMWGQVPDWQWWGAITVLSLVVMQLGYLWFMRTKGAFADVI
jgi:lipopolysaccharide transport system permease protein